MNARFCGTRCGEGKAAMVLTGDHVRLFVVYMYSKMEHGESSILQDFRK